MRDPLKPNDWPAKIPTWIKALWGSITAFAAAIILFRDNWRFYLIAAAIVIPAYVLIASIYILLARRKTRSKTKQWPYRYGNYRFLGLIGLAFVCASIMAPLALPAIPDFFGDTFLGTETPIATSTPVPTSTPAPTPTLVPTPQPAAPDVWIVPFGSSEEPVEKWIAGDLQTQLATFGLDNVTIGGEGSPITTNDQAQAILRDKKSKVVIWGWIGTSGIQANMLLAGESNALLQGTNAVRFILGGQPQSEISTTITEKLPKNVTFLSLFAIGHLQYVSNNYQAGHRAFDAAMQTLNDNPDKITIANPAILHFFRARQMDRDGADVQAVICEYTKALQIDPGFDVAYNNLGLVISKMQAEKTKLSPEAGLCLEQVGFSGDYPTLPTRLFERAVLANPLLTIARYNQFAFTWLQGDTNNAWIKLEMEDIQRQDPSLIGPYILLAVMKDREGDPAGAIQMYQSGIAVEPGIPLLHVNLGQLYLSYEKNETKAENELLEALKLDPNDRAAHLALGHLYYRQGRLSEAVSQLDQLLLLDQPDYDALLAERDALVLRSTISFAQDQSVQAIEDINLALERPFPDVLLGVLRGLLYQHEGQNDLAAESFSKAEQNQGSATQSLKYWNNFKERCFTDETYSMPFADWALTRLPSSSCLPADPSERILAVYALFNDGLFAFRERPKMIIIGGQCPYVYTEDPITGEWEFQTTILYQVVDHEAAQMRPLTQFNGRLLIREQEPEISYLNRLYVLAKMSDGSFRVLEPDVEELKHADSEYIVLHQGEEILVSLDGFPVNGEVSQWWVMAVGYYTPLGEWK